VDRFAGRGERENARPAMAGRGRDQAPPMQRIERAAYRRLVEIDDLGDARARCARLYGQHDHDSKIQHPDVESTPVGGRSAVGDPIADECQQCGHKALQIDFLGVLFRCGFVGGHGNLTREAQRDPVLTCQPARVKLGYVDVSTHELTKCPALRSLSMTTSPPPVLPPWTWIPSASNSSTTPIRVIRHCERPDPWSG